MFAEHFGGGGGGFGHHQQRQQRQQPKENLYEKDSPVVSLKQGKFPGHDAKNVWFVEFYAPWCAPRRAAPATPSARLYHALCVSASSERQALEADQHLWSAAAVCAILRCGHCQQIKPVWQQLAEDLKGVIKVGAVNCEQEKALCTMNSANSACLPSPGPSLACFPPPSAPGTPDRSHQPCWHPPAHPSAHPPARQATPQSSCSARGQASTLTGAATWRA